MNDPNTILKDLIHIERGAITPDLCDYIIKDIETREWQKHSWYSFDGEFHSEETKELDVQNITSELQSSLLPVMNQVGTSYAKKYSYKQTYRTQTIMTMFSPIRFNRYSNGQIMRQHHDHIHSLFDGVDKGIPILSFILNFNDNYEGADLYFWNDYKIPLGKGDVVIFPSLFLFPHGVTEIKKGVRYSGVAWSW